MRLFTPAGHGRARRFYEREGWTAAGPPTDENAFGMALIEYRRRVARTAARAHERPLVR